MLFNLLAVAAALTVLGFLLPFIRFPTMVRRRRLIVLNLISAVLCVLTVIANVGTKLFESDNQGIALLSVITATIGAVIVIFSTYFCFSHAHTMQAKANSAARPSAPQVKLCRRCKATAAPFSPVCPVCGCEEFDITYGSNVQNPCAGIPTQITNSTRSEDRGED